MNLPDLYKQIMAEASRVIVGQDEAFEQIVVALFSGGHVLLEGVPGTAKTLMAKTLARLVNAEFKRVQFTPDLMPSDIVGTSVFNLQTSQFVFRQGPVFTQILLADEINRAPAKTQSALLEAMEERQVSIEGALNRLPEPFMVLATQNPVEYEGTYPLPEAQLDRFLFKVRINYPALPAETEILRRYHAGFDAHHLERSGMATVLGPGDIAMAQADIMAVKVESGILDYIARLMDATRKSPDLILGGSPRAGIALLLTVKTYAALQGRDYVRPDDVKFLAPPVLRHRVILRPEAEVEGLDADKVVARVLSKVEVPR
ncbi:MAG: MoxR family ATPase [Chloroflexi bacterium]|nr:MoxR family ATPase [Chloroflexota bacterium]MCL5273913.1 MoxR family ATPase [Chloroflexota bacterium]